MISVSVRRNTLIKQGWKLRDKPEEAEMSFGDWFAEYHGLQEEQELKEGDVQTKVIDGLARDLTSAQLSRQLKESHTASL